MIGKSSFLVTYSTICTDTLPFLLSNPNTGIFPPVHLPRFPFTRVAPKYDSSISTSPENTSVSSMEEMSTRKV